ncbi:hypothetical protein [Methylorubrum sp. DB1722]|uniref:hypothetical protein n=1 Tax=Methylorubrum sp. DB1722 TaxID=2478916 RepID=UPI0018E296DE|nr:hypothetical protein [Methylorubrum sp. DB1722]
MFDNAPPLSIRCQVTPRSAGASDPITVPAPRFSGTPVDHDPFAPKPDFQAAGLWLMAGAMFYSACRTFGWVIDGFTGAVR